MAWQVEWRVLINGRDLSPAWAPVLLDIEVCDQDGTASDRCNLSVDDSDGQVALPPAGARLQVYLQGGKVFEGFIEQPRSSGSRSSGRKLTIGAKGFDSAGKVKEPQNFHLDDGSLEDFLGGAARRAGLKLTIDPAFAGIVRDYWSSEGESVLALGSRLARKLGGTFKIRGDHAVLAKRGEALAPGGAVMPSVEGVVGRNVISWDITPRDPRRVFKSGSARYFDRDAAGFKTTRLDFGAAEATGVVAENVKRAIMANADEAAEVNDAEKRSSDREAGGGSVELDLAIEAVAEGRFILRGARDGVDGTYRIASVTHKASRNGGATTRLELKEPGKGAGDDKRARRSRKGSAGGDAGFSLPKHETLG